MLKFNIEYEYEPMHNRQCGYDVVSSRYIGESNRFALLNDFARNRTDDFRRFRDEIDERLTKKNTFIPLF